MHENAKSALQSRHSQENSLMRRGGRLILGMVRLAVASPSQKLRVVPASLTMTEVRGGQEFTAWKGTPLTMTRDKRFGGNWAAWTESAVWKVRNEY